MGTKGLAFIMVITSAMSMARTSCDRWVEFVLSTILWVIPIILSHTPPMCGSPFELWVFWVYFKFFTSPDEVCSSIRMKPDSSSDSDESSHLALIKLKNNSSSITSICNVFVPRQVNIMAHHLFSTRLLVVSHFLLLQSSSQSLTVYTLMHNTWHHSFASNYPQPSRITFHKMPLLIWPCVWVWPQLRWVLSSTPVCLYW